MGLFRLRCSCRFARAGLDLLAAPAFSLNGIQDRTGCNVSEKRWKSETPVSAGVSTRLSSARLASGGVSLKKTAAATRLQKLMGRHVTHRNGMSCIFVPATTIHIWKKAFRLRKVCKKVYIQTPLKSCQANMFHALPKRQFSIQRTIAAGVRR